MGDPEEGTGDAHHWLEQEMQAIVDDLGDAADELAEALGAAREYDMRGVGGQETGEAPETDIFNFCVDDSEDDRPSEEAVPVDPAEPPVATGYGSTPLAEALSLDRSSQESMLFSLG
eukprot:13589585-Heterocapsa_arctica.AAC.1